MTLSLAFVSPALAEAAMEGRLPRGFCIKRLTDLPMSRKDPRSDPSEALRQAQAVQEVQ